MISTHSDALLSDVSDAACVLLLEPTADGTQVRPPTAQESSLIANGLSVSEVLLPKTRVQNADQLGLFA